MDKQRYWVEAGRVNDLPYSYYINGKKVVATSLCTGCKKHATPHMWIAVEGGDGRHYPIDEKIIITLEKYTSVV